MSFVFALLVGTLAGCGVWLLLRARSFDVVLGLTLIGYAVNLFIFAMGRLKSAADPILQAGKEATLANYADPLPQALVLTAIVIGFAMTALLLALSLRARAEGGSDHVDGAEPGEANGAGDAAAAAAAAASAAASATASATASAAPAAEARS